MSLSDSNSLSTAFSTVMRWCLRHIRWLTRSIIFVVVILIVLHRVSPKVLDKLGEYLGLAHTSFEAYLILIVVAMLLERAVLMEEEFHAFREEMRKNQQFPGLMSFNNSFQDVNWENILEDATEVDLCIFYSASEWNRLVLPQFETFIKNGGKLRLFLPNLGGVSSRFIETGHIKSTTEVKIVRTVREFFKLKKTFPSQITVNTLKEGINYAFAIITKQNGNLFLLSPYQNSENASQPPSILINEPQVNRVIKDYIKKESEALKKSEALCDLEDLRHIIWDQEGNRVFVSTALSCDSGCSFCYAPSLVHNAKRADIHNLGVVLGKMIIHDPRFIHGAKGTVVMFGGFCDPLQNENIEDTLQAIQILGAHNNIIHVATRYTFGASIERARNLGSNVIINYSIASFREEVELNNQLARFEEAKALIQMGVTVALYVRPVLPNVTIHEIPKLIEHCKEAGIQYVTVGGLYSDTRIKKKLHNIKIDIQKGVFTTKQFVLDKSRGLKKLQNQDDVYNIVNNFREHGLHVFLSSRELVEAVRQLRT